MNMNKTRRRRCSNYSLPKPTCYTKAQLIEFAEEWNTLHVNDKIKNIKSFNKAALWNELKQKYGTSLEHSWIHTLPKTRRKKAEQSFVPTVPQNWNNDIDDTTNWLSTDDILNVLRSYEKRYKKFSLGEIVPIDFDVKDENGECAFIRSNLCKDHYCDLAKKYNTFAIVFNTDTHDGDGQHWISMFVNLKKGEICYFDSVGDTPPIQVKRLIERLRLEGSSCLKKPVKVFINTVKHQKQNTECGMYCLNFIHHMLTNGNFFDFNKQQISDEQVFQSRKYFFDDLNNIYS